MMDLSHHCLTSRQKLPRSADFRIGVAAKMISESFSDGHLQEGTVVKGSKRAIGSGSV